MIQEKRGVSIMAQDTNKMYILGVDNQGVSMCFINTIDMYESGISITSYYVMNNEEIVARIEL